MMRARIAAAAAVIAVAVGTLGVGSAYAAPSSGTTGQDRACERHAANNGKAVAKGLECGPTFNVVLTPHVSGWCTVTITGSGLLAGATVFYDWSGGTNRPVPEYSGDIYTGNYVTVSSDGTLNATGLSTGAGQALVFHVATADGGTATFAIANSC